jgi:hypothetical protein
VTGYRISVAWSDYQPFDVEQYRQPSMRPNDATQIAKMANSRLRGGILLFLSSAAGRKEFGIQLAIEYSYRVRKRSPGTWVFWILSDVRVWLDFSEARGGVKIVLVSPFLYRQM